MNWNRSIAAALVFYCGTATVVSHAAQPAGDAAAKFPQRPVRIVIGFTPGGGPDITARFIAQKLSERWHQQVVTDNRPGAGGTIAANIVANANPDGYTLLSVSNAHAVAAAIYAKLPYDTLKDFAGITMTASGPALLLVSPALGAKSAKDLIALAKAKPGQFNFSSAGIGSGAHLAAELFKNMAGIDVVHVPFKGIPEAITETMTGRVQFFLSPLASALSLAKDGKVLAVGVSGLKRAPQLPDIPTIAESGLPGYRFEYWYGMLAPAKTPRAIIERLNREITDIMRSDEVRNRWIALGVEPVPTTPQEFDQWIRDDIATSTKLARAANIKAD
jgi:tripartite-type tricarboxylate transporter receptor subunit TctC